MLFRSGRYNGNIGSRSELDCQFCDDGSLQFEEAAATCIFASCYNITMEDSFGDGWNGGELSFKNSGTGVVMHDGLTVSALDASKAEDIICFGCGCFTGQASAGDYPGEYSWQVSDTNGEVLARAIGTSADTMCVITEVCPSCGRGSGIQPSGICGVCPRGYYSDVDDIAFCSACPPGQIGRASCRERV